MWIKIDVNLEAHPRVARLTRLLKCDKATALGNLLMFWTWARKYAEDGNITAFTDDDLTDAVIIDGGAFRDAMKKSGFLDSEGWIKDWHEWGGRQIAESIRKNHESYAEKYAAFIDHYHIHIDNAHKSALMRKSAGGKRTKASKIRLDKIRLDKSRSTSGGAVDVIALDMDLNIIKDVYPKHRVDGVPASRAWVELNPDAEMVAAAKEGLKALLVSDEWKKDDGAYVPKLSNFIIDQRWMDVPTVADQQPCDHPIDQREATNQPCVAYCKKCRKRVAE